MSQTQLIFDFLATPTANNKFCADNFLLAEENKAARTFLEKFFQQTSPLPSAILKGERASGKSHLLHIFAKKFSATFLQQENFDNANFFHEKEFYILENINEITNEETLLHIINSAAEAKAFLILSATDITCFSLKDLVSRLKNIFTVEIKKPSTEFIKLLLAQGLAQRQLKISDEVIEFLSIRLRPSYSTLQDSLKMIEFSCHENKKSFTLTEARKLIAATL